MLSTLSSSKKELWAKPGSVTPELREEGGQLSKTGGPWSQLRHQEGKD